ncbi:MAG TPA: DUF4214 domain-containing protein [Cellulomonadaceae bacterium]|nr:DUF4214 domain-containing protein [Cellulomonadaceae bacterium]
MSTSVASAFPVAPSAGLSVSDVATTVTLTATQQYVTSVYRDLFNRAPDPSGLATWTQSINAGTPRIAVANAITSSAEYRSGLIVDSYRTYLNRAPDAAGLQSWLASMNRGLAVQSMEAGFVGSAEYYARAGGTDATWVAQLYRNVLGRAAASQEISFWTGQLKRGLSRAGVASGFLYSTEHLSAVIDGDYVHLLGRHIDPSGQATWVGAIQHGSRIEQVIGGIIASSEYMLGHGGSTAATPVASSSASAGVRPSGVSTGVPVGTVLTAYHGDLVITTPGTVIDSLDVFGFVTIKAANVTIKNSRVRGSGPGSFNTGLINCTGAGVVNAVIQDVTLAPDYPSVWVDGVLGHDFTATRVNTYGVVDGFGVYNTSGPAANVTIASSWVHDLSYFSPDPNHPDNQTHNDAIQIQGGSNIQVVGNELDAYLSTSVGTQSYPYPQAGFGVIVTPNVAPVTGSRIDHNWITGSYIPIKLTTGTWGATTFGQVNDNRFAHDMRNVPMNGVSQWFTILMTPDTTATTTGDVYDDTGAPVTVRHDSGTSTAP